MQKVTKMFSGLLVTAFGILWAIPSVAGVPTFGGGPNTPSTVQVPEPATLALLGLGLLGLAGLRKKIK